MLLFFYHICAQNLRYIKIVDDENRSVGPSSFSSYFHSKGTTCALGLTAFSINTTSVFKLWGTPSWGALKLYNQPSWRVPKMYSEHFWGTCLLINNLEITFSAFDAFSAHGMLGSSPPLDTFVMVYLITYI